VRKSNRERHKGEKEEKRGKAGAELCQAQLMLMLAVLIRMICSESLNCFLLLIEMYK
jgi:hypothetical protein